MRSPEVRRDLAMLAALGLIVNSLAARYVSLPGYVDAYYYFGGAVQLARGQGFTEPYLWNYLAVRDAGDNAARHWPSHLYWMPLTSLVAAPFVAGAEAVTRREMTLPDLFRVSQVPFVALAAALPLVSYGIARALAGGRRHAVAAALLTLFSAYFFIYWTTTDAFALFGALAAVALGLGSLAAQWPNLAGRSMLLAGIAAGLAHLTRADGVLVLLCLATWWVARHQPWRRAAHPPTASPVQSWLLPLLGLGLGYLCVMGPWFARNWSVVGAPIAPGGARTMWLVQYDDFFTYRPEQLSPDTYLAAGWSTIVSGKLDALRANLATLIGVQANVIALPLAAIGAWRLRRHPLMQLAALHGLVLFLLMTLIFPFPGSRGGYFHSAGAGLPFIAAAAMAGLDAVVDATARRLRHWQPARAKPGFTVLLVSLTVFMAVALFAAQVLGAGGARLAWAQRDAVYAEAGRWLAAHGQAGAAVAVNNPPGWYYHTGQPAIVIPAGDTNTLLAAMDEVEVAWLVLDANVPAGLRSLYAAPAADLRFQVTATFADASGRPVILLRRASES